MTDLKFYSFYMGVSGTRMSMWRLEDIKMPAQTVREAVILHHIQRQLRYKYQSNYHSRNFVLSEPDQVIVFDHYRMILEYKRKPAPEGWKYKHEYKLIRQIPPHRFKQYFAKRRS